MSGFEGALAQAKVFLEQELNARAKLCSAEFGAALGDLRTRLGWVTQDLEALTIAAEVEEAREGLATAHERVPNKANFAGTEKRLLKVRQDLRGRSDREARRLWQKAFDEADYTNVDWARAALTELKRVLRDEFLYLETANSTNVVTCARPSEMSPWSRDGRCAGPAVSAASVGGERHDRRQ